MSSEARSTGGTLMSVTRNTTHSLEPAPAVCPTPSFAVRNAALIALARNVAGRLTVGQAAGAVDGVEGDGGEPQFLRGLDHAGAAAALVFHLVAQLRNLGARAFRCDFLLQVGGDALIRWFDPGLDLADLHERHAEPALHRLANLSGRQRKRRIGDRGIDH